MPLALQQAFDREALTLVTARRVALLDQEVQQRIAKRIQWGENANDVAAEFLGKSYDESETNQAFRRMIKAVLREMARLRGREAEITLIPHATHLSLFKDAERLVREAAQRSGK
jgi:hypothetical protein